MKHDPVTPDGRPDMLEDRLREVETAAASTDFDLAAWIWMILLGAVFPLGLIIYGWCSMVSGR
jgi:hypothetical protein